MIFIIKAYKIIWIYYLATDPSKTKNYDILKGYSLQGKFFYSYGIHIANLYVQSALLLSLYM